MVYTEKDALSQWIWGPLFSSLLACADSVSWYALSAFEVWRVHVFSPFLFSSCVLFGWNSLLFSGRSSTDEWLGIVPPGVIYAVHCFTVSRPYSLLLRSNLSFFEAPSSRSSVDISFDIRYSSSYFTVFYFLLFCFLYLCPLNRTTSLLAICCVWKRR
ncbi:hypothetical protein K438DRAFT_532535 [Mycena galopus ATCC 62051]|nr:hypothetical protein K438DRAFT_532535 [Mycena galopus ATCC 62051]